MELSAKQKEIVQATEDKIIVIANAAAGKAQPVNTIVPTPTGYMRLGELRPGNEVFNRFGEPEKIIAVFPQGKKQIYQVTFSDGRETQCCGSHLWSYYDENGQLVTEELYTMYKSGVIRLDKPGCRMYKYYIPSLKKPVAYNSKKYEIDPYVMGVFIGNNSFSRKYLSILTKEEWVVQKVAKILNLKYQRSMWCGITEYVFLSNDEKITVKQFLKQKPEVYHNCLMGTIQENYLTGSIDQRFYLLQGLMDISGLVGGGKCDNPSCKVNSYITALNIAELIRSLGIGARVSESYSINSQRAVCIVDIYINNQERYKIFSDPKKVEAAMLYAETDNQIPARDVYITNIEKTNLYVDMVCILVDHEEHLYLTNDFIVTHNTTVLIERIKYLLNIGVNPKKIVAITFTKLAAQEIKKRIGAVAKDCFIGTVHSYCNYLLTSSGVQTRELIEEEKFDKLFKLIKSHPESIRNVDYLLLDEAQDSKRVQFEFILNFVKPNHYMLVGDFRQCIYRFNSSDPQYLINLIHQEDVKVYNLNENYRNGTKILDYAKTIIRQNGQEYIDSSIPMRKIEGKVITVEFSLKAIVRDIKKINNYGNWFILCRWNKDVIDIANAFEEARIPYSIIRRKDFNSNEELQSEMRENTVKIMTIHASKGLEADNVIVVGATFDRHGPSEEREENICINYVAATRARNLLVWTYSIRRRVHHIKEWE